MPKSQLVVTHMLNLKPARHLPYSSLPELNRKAVEKEVVVNENDPWLAPETPAGEQDEGEHQAAPRRSMVSLVLDGLLVVLACFLSLTYMLGIAVEMMRENPESRFLMYLLSSLAVPLMGALFMKFVWKLRVRTIAMIFIGFSMLLYCGKFAGQVTEYIDARRVTYLKRPTAFKKPFGRLEQRHGKWDEGASLSRS